MSDCEGEVPPPSLAATRSRRENAGKKSAKTASKFAALVVNLVMEDRPGAIEDVLAPIRPMLGLILRNVDLELVIGRVVDTGEKLPHRVHRITKGVLRREVACSPAPESSTSCFPQQKLLRSNATQLEEDEVTAQVASKKKATHAAVGSMVTRALAGAAGSAFHIDEDQREKGK